MTHEGRQPLTGSRGPGRRWWAIIGLLAVLVGAQVISPGAAQAHALLVASSPADGQTMEVAPAAVRLEFSEDVQVAATVAEMFDGDGKAVVLGTPKGEPAAATAPVVLIPMPELGQDRYLLRWRTISASDLHPVTGALVFGVGREVQAGSASTISGWEVGGSAAEAVLRWLALLALGMALAALAISRRLALRFPDDSAGVGYARPVLPRARATLAGGGALATVALAALFLGRIALVVGAPAVVSAWGFTLRWVIAVAASAMAWRLLRRPGSNLHGPSASTPVARARTRDLLAACLLVVAMTAVTSTSHAVAAGSGWALVAGVHTVTTMVWSCGAIIVALVAIPALADGDRGRAVGVARSFTPIALVCVPVSLCSGLLLSGRLVPSVGALAHTGYGQVLLVKLALLALGLACAAATVVLLVLGGGRRRSGLAVGIEAGVLGVVVLAASAVASIHPASPVVWAPTPDPPPTVGVLSHLVDDLVVTTTVGPGRPGRNFVTIDVLDTRRPAPEPITAVRVAVAGQPPLTAVPQGGVEWVAVANLTHEGPMSVQVWADRTGLPTAQASFAWQVGPVAGTRIGGARLAPISAAAALVLGIGAACAGLTYGLLRRRRRRHVTIGVTREARSARVG